MKSKQERVKKNTVKSTRASRVKLERVVSPQKLFKWYSLYITKKQLDYLKLLCNYHIKTTTNPDAKRKSEKTLHCLNSKNFVTEMDERTNTVLNITKVINEQY